ncbi:uncharacterized protein LOC101853840 [Aplysia californica]|uniref:Uncharacterized protein LOC101853840 n=1 Tax=Aplysia californica TaxID=6500 RepID=A0ABM0JH51_APLCA|nr:uncharacterized protein LOC101853840 [Aplysia californica]XP_005093559.1 uncharacterized protein LOC101853840 [Aplysia californica]
MTNATQSRYRSEIFNEDLNLPDDEELAQREEEAVMTVACTPSESPVQGHPLSDSRLQQLVEDLADEAEQQAVLDTVAIETEQEDDIPEMVCGWGCSTSSLPKAPQPKRVVGLRRRNPRAMASEIDTSKMVVRCVKEDYNSEHHKIAWKANVEPGTYRYICNNGIYRSTKFANTGTDWVTAKRSRFFTERSVPNPEVRQAQRTLKKDLNQHFRAQQQEHYLQIPEHPTFHLTHGPSLRQSDGLVVPSTAPTVNVTGASSPRAATCTESSRPITNDQQKDPKMVKSASDLFVENFSSRMTAFEKEKSDVHPKTPDNGLKPGTIPASAVSAIHNTHLRRIHDSPDTAKFLAKQAEDIAKDVFMVKPVLRAEQPLKPLEKLTPQQKNSERHGNESDRGSTATNSNRESPSLSTSFMTAMNAFAQIHHQHNRETNQSKSNPTTFRQHPGRQSIISNCSGTSQSDTDSLSSVRNALTLTNNDIEKMRSCPSMNYYAMRDYSRFLTGKGGGKLPGPTNITGKTQGSQRRAALASKVLSTSNIHHHHSLNSASSYHGGSSHFHASIGNGGKPNAGEDVRSITSDPATETTSVNTSSVSAPGKTLREAKAQSMSLPEIAGKRLSVAASSHRML